MKVTIKDIARECGVSVSAVSMALSDKPSRISAKTKEKVLEAARKLNYQPNQAAVSLATKKSRKIGVIINDLRNPHIADIFMALDREIQAGGYLQLCHVLDDDSQGDAVKYLQRMVSNDVAGIVWGKPLEERELEELKSYIDHLDIPVVTMGESDFACRGVDVVFDYGEAAYLATQHLVELGHTRIGCVAGTPYFKVTEERLQGYRKALEEAGIPYDEELIFYGNYTLKSGRNSLAYLLGKKVTAIFSMNDDMAFGIYESARNYGVKIPEELSIVGCDNVSFGNSLEVPLTTVNVSAVEVGRSVGKWIIKTIEDETLCREKRLVERYHPALLVKGSTMRVK